MPVDVDIEYNRSFLSIQMKPIVMRGRWQAVDMCETMFNPKLGNLLVQKRWSNITRFLPSQVVEFNNIVPSI